MALVATPYLFDLELNHPDRGLSLSLAVRTARHPSESLDRLWLRLLAYAWLYEERLAFGPGLSDPDAPDLAATDLTGQTTLWVRVGRPDPVKLQREADRCGRARVAALFDAPQRLEAFAAAAREAGCTRLGRAELAAVDAQLLAALASRDERRVKLGLTFVGDHLYVDVAGEALDGPMPRATLP
jgi:uncharacterized protein YaeQ